ncbi:TetR/AcrR family transcriptional regulator [Okibacterium endophyticum]
MTKLDTAQSEGKRRGAYAKTGMKRAAILDAALAVFARSGYRAGSIREVAETVGMSEAGLLHHFPNKSALLAGVLELRNQHSADFVPLDPQKPRETLRGLVALAAYNVSVPGVVELYCVLSAEATAPEHPAHRYFADRYARTRSDLTGQFERLAEQGDLCQGTTPDAAARMSIAVMDGLQVQWLLDRSSVDMAAELRSFLQGLVTFTL